MQTFWAQAGREGPRITQCDEAVEKEYTWGREPG